MEELRSTEILDKEIQADARKKAERILTAADAECKSVLDSVANRVAVITKEQTEVFDKKITQFEHDADAALPLEKQRYFVSFTGKSVMDAINAYLSSLDSEKRFSLLENLFERCRKVLKGKKVSAFVYGCDIQKAGAFLKKQLGSDLVSCSEIEFGKTGQDARNGLEVHEGIILETEDHSVKARLTLEELVAEITDTYNIELVNALFPGRQPE